MSNEFELYLKSQFSSNPNPIEDAELYSLLAGGKRIRPELLFSVLDDCDIKRKEGYPSATAIEFIHTYSLIHDDLPAMDNDDFRRGKPSNHIVFGEAKAILAGDALLTKAFETLASQQTKYLPQILYEVANAAGDHGMILGQAYDLAAEGNTKLSIDDCKRINIHKTSKLIALPLVVGAYLANKPNDVELLRELGILIGIAFQIQDDILEVTSSAEELGKSLSDQKNDKTNYVTILGIDNSQKYLNQLFDEIEQILNKLSFSAKSLKNTIDLIKNRKK